MKLSRQSFLMKAIPPRNVGRLIQSYQEAYQEATKKVKYMYYHTFTFGEYRFTRARAARNPNRLVGRLVGWLVGPASRLAGSQAHTSLHFPELDDARYGEGSKRHRPSSPGARPLRTKFPSVGRQKK
jgi:hypothetical protein